MNFNGQERTLKAKARHMSCNDQTLHKSSRGQAILTQVVLRNPQNTVGEMCTKYPGTRQQMPWRNYGTRT